MRTSAFVVLVLAVLMLGASSVALPAAYAESRVVPRAVEVASPASSDPGPSPMQTVSITGQTFDRHLFVVVSGKSGFIFVTVSGNKIHGDLRVIVTANVAVIRIKVDVSKNEVEGDLGVRVSGNDFDHTRGEDCVTDVVNNTVGQDLRVDVHNNWVKRDLRTSVTGNRALRDATVSLSPQNIVNNMNTLVKDNRACGRFDVRALFNVIDVAMTTYVQSNDACERLRVEISYNEKPQGWPMLFTLMIANVTDNHVLDGMVWIEVEQNDMAIQGSPLMRVEIFGNGGRKDFIVRVRENKALPGVLLADMRENAADARMAVLIINNAAAQITITVTKNYAFAARPIVTTQKDPQPGNAQRDLQAQGRDGDFDGLSDSYESMITGTNPTDWDTDSDGLVDGWHDTVGDRRWQAGEGFGELGSPRQPGVGGDADRNAGSIATLFDKMFENPNALCPDLYVEVDHMQGHAFPGYVANTLVRLFKRHGIRLHVDDGWPEGAGMANRGIGGGEPLPHVDPFWLLRAPGANNDFHDFKQVHFDANRRGIFRYAIVGHRYRENAGSTGGVPYKNSVFDADDLFLADDRIDEVARLSCVSSWSAQTGTFLHELGHTLGLVPAGFLPSPFDGIDEPQTDSMDPNYDPALFANYMSVMNYHYQFGPVDYSDGSHGPDAYGNPDFDDWSAISLARIDSDWNVYEG